MFPPLGFAKASAKANAIAYRQIRVGDELWIGENNYAYPFARPNKRPVFVANSTSSTSDQFFVSFINGDTLCSVQNSTNKYLYLVDAQFAYSKSNSAYDSSAHALLYGCPNLYNTTLTYGWSNTISTTFFYSAGSTGAISGIAHSITGLVYTRGMNMRRQGDLVLFFAGPSSYPHFKVVTTAGAQVITDTTIESTVMQANVPGAVIILPDDGFVFVWPRVSTNDVMIAIYNADGTQRVAPTSVESSGTIASGNGNVVPNTWGGVLPNGTIFIASTLKAYFINPSTGATFASYSIPVSSNVFQGCTVAFGLPIVYMTQQGSNTGSMSILILDPISFTLKESISVMFESPTGTTAFTLKYSGKCTTGNLLFYGDYVYDADPGSTNGGCFMIEFPLDWVKKRYRALSDATAGNPVLLETI